ncbi:cation:proton antiporter [Ponticaulis sp.]|uniref:cation:proton antiporter domain-containing protein n=1 Tax=Ponticaulis sp. TaxID=2020902 RepID=UPI000C3FFBF6|nr:cation:proton antiporter [Ponticaulis sp.]MBN04318.1 potassium transporter KefB [Ponticaulis sp.]
MTPVEALQPVIALLGAGTVAALTSRALKLSPMVGYIVAGMAIGPYGLNAIEEGDVTHLLAEMGVVFLLFDIGLHFSLNEVKNSRRDIFFLAPLQMAICALVFIGGAIMLNISIPVAIAIGVSLALSSTAVVTQILGERDLNTCPAGRSSVAVLVFQDVVAIFLLIFANSLESDPARLATAMGIAAGQSILAFIAAALIGRYMVRPLFRVLASAQVPEIFTMTTVLIVVAAATATGAIGLSLTLGAFLAGMAIADSPFRHSIQTEVSPFRGLLISFFFVNVGMMIDLPSVGSNILLVMAVALGIMLIKTVMIFLAARINKWNLPGATRLAFLLPQASEFTLVVLSLAAVRVGTPGNWISILVGATALSLALAPAWAGLGIKLSRRIAQKLAEGIITGTTRNEAQEPEEKPQAILFGMTPSNRIIADALLHLNIPHVALDNDPKRFIAAASDGYKVTFGAASDFRMLSTLDAMQAKALVLGLSNYTVSKSLTTEVHERFPKLTRFVVVESVEDHARHKALGMQAHLGATSMDSIALAGEVLRTLDVSEERIEEWTSAEIERLGRDEATASTPETTEAA